MGMPSASVERRYSGRRDDIVAINISLSRDAARLLCHHAPHSKAHGRFLSELIVEYDRQLGFQDFFRKETGRQLRRLFKEIRQEIHAPSSDA